MNYHDRAMGDIKVAKLLLSPSGNPSNDEVLIDCAAYHTQQAVEKELKYILHDLLGVDDTTPAFKTHRIADIIVSIEEQGYQIPDSIKEIAHDLTEWESSSRYNSDIVAEHNEISSAIGKYDELVDTANSIENELEQIENDISNDDYDIDNDFDDFER